MSRIGAAQSLDVRVRRAVVASAPAAALVDGHDDRVDAVPLELRDRCIDRVGLVEELQAGDAGRRHDRRRLLQHRADEADRNAVGDS